MKKKITKPRHTAGVSLLKIAILHLQIAKAHANIAALREILSRSGLPRRKALVRKVLEAEKIFLEVSRESLLAMEKKLGIGNPI